MKSSSINYAAPCGCVFDLFVVGFSFYCVGRRSKDIVFRCRRKDCVYVNRAPGLLHNLKDFSDSDGFILISKRKAAHLGEEFKLL